MSLWRLNTEVLKETQGSLKILTELQEGSGGSDTSGEVKFQQSSEHPPRFCQCLRVLIAKEMKFATLGIDRGGRESFGGEEPVLFGPSGWTTGTRGQQDQVAAVPNALHPDFPFPSSPAPLTPPHRLLFLQLGRDPGVPMNREARAGTWERGQGGDTESRLRVETDGDLEWWLDRWRPGNRTQQGQAGGAGPVEWEAGQLGDS